MDISGLRPQSIQGGFIIFAHILFPMSYLDELNQSQREAVESIYGPTMVIAGAGSGKTRVLTYRIAYMMEQGIVVKNKVSIANSSGLYFLIIFVKIFKKI